MTGQPPALAAHVALDFVKCVRGEVREAAVLEVAPQKFDGIEVRGIGRKPDDTTAGMSGQPGSDERVPMRAAPIPHEDERTAHMATEMAEKSQHLRPFDVEPGMEREGERDAPTPWRDDQCPDARDLLMLARADRDGRRSPALRPGAAQDRHHQEARLIETDEVGAEVVQFFLPWPSRLAPTPAHADRRVPWPAAEAVAG
jgi:hypothetical protein